VKETETTTASKFEPASYWEDRLSAHYNEQGVGDIGLPVSYNAYLYAVRRRVFRRVARALELPPAASRVLDIGPGTGVYIDEWRRWGAMQVTGADITRTAVDALSAKFPDARFVQADVGEAQLPAPLSPGAFDVVSAFDVLFHIVDDVRYDRAIGNIAELLRPKGWFLYSDNLVARPSEMAHFVTRSERTILDTLTRHGFRIVRRVPMFVLMNDPTRTDSRVLRKAFNLVYRAARRGPLAGKLVGGALYPLELLLTQVVSHGPGTEILLCQRV
jgi:SAM-dependent methyltransferase